jgi:hypothetical protein
VQQNYHVLQAAIPSLIWADIVDGFAFDAGMLRGAVSNHTAALRCEQCDR